MAERARPGVIPVIFLVLGLVAAGMVLQVGQYAASSVEERWRAERLNEAAGLRAQLEGQINGVANLTAGLIAEVARRGGITREDFERHARELVGEHSLIINITLAPGHVIDMVYPLDGNVSAIGLDLLHHTVQGAATRLMLERGGPVLAGPVDLVQGGRGLIHRVPIYLSPPDAEPRSGAYWGMMSTPIDFDGLLREAGLANEDGFRLALRGRDGLGAAGEVFWGDAALFEAPGGFVLDVKVLDGSWQLVADPLGQPPDQSRLLVLSRLAAALLALLTVVLVGVVMRANHRLARSEALHREIAEQMRDVLFRTDRNGRLRYLSPAWARITGRAGEDALGQPWSRLLHPDDRVRAERDALRLNDGGTAFEDTFRAFSADGDVRQLVVRATRNRDSHGRAGGLTGMMIDITEQRRIGARLAVASRVFERSGEGIVVFDSDGTVRSVNPAFTRITGREPDAVVGRRRDPFVGVGDDSVLMPVWRALDEEDYWQGEVDARRVDDTPVVLALSMTAVRDERGERVELLAICSDVTERRAQEKRVQHLALHDPLTGLANRIQLANRFEQAVALAVRGGTCVGLLYIDLDGFKPINDTWGHDTGDRMLCHVARQLALAVRESDTVARIGGDEFVILVGALDDCRDVGAVVRKVRVALDVPLSVEGRGLSVSASVGLACYPDDGRSLDELLRVADRDMYDAKLNARRARGLALD